MELWRAVIYTISAGIHYMAAAFTYLSARLDASVNEDCMEKRETPHDHKER